MHFFLRLTLTLTLVILAQCQHNSNQLDERSVIVHMFEWKFSDIASECEQWLGPRGYGAVQVTSFFYPL